MSYYWISKQKNLGRNIKYGDEIKGLPGDLTKEEEKERFKLLIGQGVVSEKKPESITSSEKNKIVEVAEVNESLRQEVAALKSEVSELREESDKTASVKLKEAKEEIKELKDQLEVATAPGGTS